MADTFEQFGIRFVTEGAKGAVSDINLFNTAILGANGSLLDYDKTSAKTSKTDEKASKSKEQLGKSAKSATVDIKGMVDELLKMTGIGGELSPILSSVSSMLGKFTGSLGIATAGLAAFVALGVRGAGLRGIIEGFDELAQSTGQSTDAFLANLKRASAGTVSETDLMTKANLALAGATGEVAVELGKRLPEVLELARAQARRTGQSTEFLFQSLVTGIKRSSPLLIDNTGLVLSVGKANEDYAKKLGISVEQLTEQDKQIALLNATLEAGADSVAALGLANETASEKMARAQSTIKNILDGLSLAVQPAFEQVLDVINSFLSAIEFIVKPITQVVYFILRGFQLMTDGIVFIFNGITSFISNSLLGILHSLTGFSGTWGDLWTTATQLVQLAFIEMSRSVGTVMGAFVNGLLIASLRINQVIAIIAQGIADFLVGESPPPKGPLSQIDKGGENTMLAWLDGFAGASLEPVSQVASEVDMLMGNIGSLSLPQVERRLARLDAAIKPFEDRLKIIEAQLEAIQEPANAAIRAIERQQNALADAFNAGNQEAAQMIRNLDAQRAMIEQNLSFEEARVDAAKIQLGLAKSLQAEERAKLEIRKAELGTTQKIAKQTKAKTPKTSGAKEPKGGGAGESPVAATGAAMPVQQGQTGVDRLFSQGGAAFQEGFAGQIDTSLFGQITEAQTAQKNAFAKIKTADPVAAIVGKFKGLGSKIQSSISNSLSSLGDWLNRNLIMPMQLAAGVAIAWLTDTNLEGGLAYGISHFDISQYGASISTSISTWFDTNVSTPFTSSIANIASYLTDTANPESLAYAISNFNLADLGINISEGIRTFFNEQLVLPFQEGFASIIGYFSDPQVVGGIANFFANVQAKGLANVLGLGGLWEMFSLFVQENIATPMLDIITGLFSFDGENSIIRPFVTIGGTILEAAGDLLPVIRSMFNGFMQWIFGNTDDGGLPGIIEGLLANFRLIPTGIWTALQGIGRLMWDVFVKPFIEAINVVIRQINAFFGAFTTSGLAQFARDTLNFDIPEVVFNELSTSPPAALTNVPPPPGARRGGIFDGGAVDVGESGRETMMSAKPFAVFSNQFIQAMDMFAGTVNTLSAVVMRQAGGNVDNRSIDNSINMSFRGSDRSAGQQAAFMAGLRQGS